MFHLIAMLSEHANKVKCVYVKKVDFVKTL